MSCGREYYFCLQKKVVRQLICCVCVCVRIHYSPVLLSLSLTCMCVSANSYPL